MSMHKIPSHACFRPGTVDEAVWRQVVEANEYGLPEHFGHPDTWVLDIGGHSGSFSWRCAVSGAQVVCVEPSRENYHYLAHNLKPVWDRVLLVNAAVWRSDRPITTVGFQPNWQPVNTGGGCTMGDAQTAECHKALAIPLDDLLRLRPIWEIVKIDCEGAEMVILPTSRELGRVKKIVGEFHERCQVTAGNDCGVEPNMAALADCLRGKGFEVTYEEGKKLGLFTAVKP